MRGIVFILFASGLILISIPERSLGNEESETSYSETETSPVKKEPVIDIPPGMELRKVGNINIVVPEGTQIRKNGSNLIMEGPDEYVARNVREIKGRLAEIETRQLEHEKKLDGLKQAISEVRKRPEASDNNPASQ